VSFCDLLRWKKEIADKWYIAVRPVHYLQSIRLLNFWRPLNFEGRYCRYCEVDRSTVAALNIMHLSLSS
jgi:hypothetical protein